MTINIYEEHPASVMQEMLVRGIAQEESVTLDFSRVLNVDESYLKEVFSALPDTREALSKIRVTNATKLIVNSLSLVINSRVRGKL